MFMPSDLEKKGYIQSATPEYSFEVTMKLDQVILSENSQESIRGEFTGFGCNWVVADFALHAAGGDPHPILWMTERQEGYGFTMESESSMRFKANRL